MLQQEESESSRSCSEQSSTITAEGQQAPADSLNGRSIIPLFRGHLTQPIRFVDNMSNCTFTDSPVHLHYNTYNFTISNHVERHNSTDSQNRHHESSSVLHKQESRNSPSNRDYEADLSHIGQLLSIPDTPPTVPVPQFNTRPSSSSSASDYLISPPSVAAPQNSSHSTSTASISQPARYSSPCDTCPKHYDANFSSNRVPSSPPQNLSQNTSPLILSAIPVVQTNFATQMISHINSASSTNFPFPAHQSLSQTHPDIEKDPHPPSERTDSVHVTVNAPIINCIYCTMGLFYRLGLLFLPSIYLSRVGQLVSESALNPGVIVDFTFPARSRQFPTQNEAEAGFAPPPLAYRELHKEWKLMIDDFVQEWRTMIIVSVILVLGLLTFLQSTNAGSDPVTRNLAFVSLMQATWSLMFCCLYIIRFRRTRSRYTMVVWTVEAAFREKHNRFWNIWVMLALPAVMLAWTLVLFMVTIICFLWTSRPTPGDLAPGMQLGFRIVTCIFSTRTMVYFVLTILKPFHYSAKDHERLERRLKPVRFRA